MKTRVTAGIVFLTLGGFAQAALAQDAAAVSGTSPWYVGVGLSKSQASIPQQTITAIDTAFSGALGSTFTIVDKDERSTGLKAILGYGFNRYFSVEGGYAVIGGPKVSFDFRAGLNSVGTFNMEYSMTSIFADAVGMMPLGDNWELIGRVGVNVGKTKIDLSGSPLTLVLSNDDREETKVREKFGAGIQYKFTSAVALRAEWDHYKMPDPFSDKLIDVNTATASLLYRF